MIYSSRASSDISVVQETEQTTNSKLKILVNYRYEDRNTHTAATYGAIYLFIYLLICIK